MKTKKLIMALLALGAYFSANAQTPSWLANGTTSYNVNPITTLVGIGTLSPTNSLEVDYSNSSLTNLGSAVFVNTFNNYDANPTVSYPVASFLRYGKGGFSYGNNFSIGLSRYENVGTNARTQVDFKLSNGYSSTPDITVMSLRGNGNVGITTTNPVSKLSFGSSASAVFNSSASKIAIHETSAGTNFYGIGGYIDNPAADITAGLGLWGGTEGSTPWNGTSGVKPHLFILRNSGNVGIGTTTPSTTLEVNGTVKALDYVDANGVSIVKPWMKANNIVFGSGAGASITTGLYNVAIGVDAGSSGTDMSNNDFIGGHAGANVLGYDNVAIGQSALQGVTGSTAANNVAIGSEAGENITTGNSNFFGGHFAGNSNTEGIGNVCVGAAAGQQNRTGNFNTYIGYSSGQITSTANQNIGIGYGAGVHLNSNNNIAIGSNTLAGGYNSYITGANNTAIGQNAGTVLTSGDNNIFLGTNAGAVTSTGVSNVYIGKTAGGSNNGDRNVFIGDLAGTTETAASHKLIIGTQDNSNLIYGDFLTGQLAIGTKTFYGGTTDPYTLSVNGKVACKELKVDVNWSDFVFENNYKLLKLNDVETYIKANKHLPEVPSATEVECNGLRVGEMQAKMMQKIEELTLYIIEQQKHIEALEMKTMKQ